MGKCRIQDTAQRPAVRGGAWRVGVLYTIYLFTGPGSFPAPYTHTMSDAVLQESKLPESKLPEATGVQENVSLEKIWSKLLDIETLLLEESDDEEDSGIKVPDSWPSNVPRPYRSQAPVLHVGHLKQLRSANSSRVPDVTELGVRPGHHSDRRAAARFRPVDKPVQQLLRERSGVQDSDKTIQ